MGPSGLCTRAHISLTEVIRYNGHRKRGALRRSFRNIYLPRTYKRRLRAELKTIKRTSRQMNVREVLIIVSVKATPKTNQKHGYFSLKSISF